jgi:hypothetical protein
MSAPGIPDAERPVAANGGSRVFRRGPWENGSAVVIGLGLFMLMQPFALELYTWSFVVILVGTVGFLITSHFPD